MESVLPLNIFRRSFWLVSSGQWPLMEDLTLGMILTVVLAWYRSCSTKLSCKCELVDGVGLKASYLPTSSVLL